MWHVSMWLVAANWVIVRYWLIVCFQWRWSKTRYCQENKLVQITVKVKLHPPDLLYELLTHSFSNFSRNLTKKPVISHESGDLMIRRDSEQTKQISRM